MKTRRLGHAGCVMLALLATGGTAHAIPIQLTRTQFEALTAGNPSTQVEDFESFGTGLNPSPLQLVNGRVSFTEASPNIQTGNCSSGKCLTANNVVGTRVFDDFPTGTQLWGTDFAAIVPSNVFDITVVGGSGTLSLDDVVASDFFGFQDSLGITSVSFENTTSAAPFGGYAFDDVTTAVPEPSTAFLLAVGLAGLAARRRRHTP